MFLVTAFRVLFAIFIAYLPVNGINLRSTSTEPAPDSSLQSRLFTSAGAHCSEALRVSQSADCIQADRSEVTPDPSDGSVIYPRNFLLQLRQSPLVQPPTGEAHDTLLRLRLLKRGRRRGVRAGRKSCRPIYVVVSARRNRRPPGLELRPPTILITPHRQPARSTGRNAQMAPTVRPPPPGTGAAVTAGSKIVLELLNIQSLLPKLPDIRAELHLRDADILCYTETNLKSGMPDRLINLPGTVFYDKTGK